MLSRFLLISALYFFMSSTSLAVECSAVFPYGLQNNDLDGDVTFHNSAQLIDSPEDTLASIKAIIDYSNGFTCGDVDCDISHNIALTISFDDFVADANDITLNFGGEQTLTPGDYNNITLNGNAILTLTPGDYWIAGSFTHNSSANIIISGSGLVRLFIQSNIALNSSGGLNKDGNASQLLLYSASGITIGSSAKVAGFIYSTESVTLGSSAIVDGAINAKQITLGSSSIVNFSSVMPDSCDAPPPTLTLAPILDYRFDECSYDETAGEVIDQSGNYHASTNNVPSPIGDTIINNSLDLTTTGTSDWLSVPNDSIDDLDDFSLSFWMKVDGDNIVNNIAQQTIIHAIGSGNGDDQLLLFFNNATRLRIAVDDVRRPLDAFNSLIDNTWQHIVVTRQGSNVCLFVNSIENQCRSNSSGNTLSLEPDEKVIIGQRQYSAGNDFDDFGNNQSFEGKLDEFKIYNRQLSATEILTIYSNELAKNNYDGSTRDAVICDLIEVVAGRVTLNNTTDSPEFTHVCFDTPFSVVPVVFSIPTTVDDGDRLTLRFRNVTEYGFDIAQVESPEAANPNSPAGNIAQTVDFLAIVEGDYNLHGGATMQVGTITTDRYQAKSNSTSSWEIIELDALYSREDEVPALITAIQTMNNEPNVDNDTGPFPISDPFLATAIDDVTDTQFSIALERGETDIDVLTATETIAYLTISSGLTGLLTDDISYESFRFGLNDSSRNTSFCNDEVTFSGGYSNTPLVIASQNSRNGVDGAWLKRCAISSTSASFSIVEDMDSDSDIDHTSEFGGGLALGGSFKDFTNSCPLTIDHFEIDTKNGQGLTCEPDVINIKACADSLCTTVNSDAVDVVLSISNTDGIVLNKEVTVSGTLGVDVEYIHTTAEVVTLSLDQTFECINGIPNDCEVTFADAGFLFSNIPTQLSGKASDIGFNNSDLYLQAIRTDTDTGACVGAFPNGGDVPVGLSYSCDAGNCQDALVLTNNSNDYTLTATPTEIPLQFSIDSIAYFDIEYPDAAKFILNAEKELTIIDGAGNSAVKNLAGSSNAFVERPFAFDIFVDKNVAVTDSDYASNPAATTASGDVFTVAADEIRISTRAVAWKDGDDVNENGLADQGETLTTNPTTENFINITLDSLSFTRVEPDTGVVGVLTVTDGGNFNAGVKTDTAEYNEVGIISLTMDKINYLSSGINITGTAPYVGRFTPAYFTQTVYYHGSLKANHDADCLDKDWAYAGQSYNNEPSNDGAITYDGIPVIEINAFNLDDELTQNYTETGFMKLVKADITITTPTRDDEKLRLEPSVVDETILLTAEMSVGDDLVVSASKGVINYTFNASDHFTYEHTKHSKVAAFAAKIPFLVTSVEDSDVVNLYTGSDPAIEPTEKVLTEGVEIRFGRWLLENSYGPETSPLPMDMTIQYFDGTKFTNNTNEICLMPAIGDPVTTGDIGDANMDLWHYRLGDLDSTDNLLTSHTTPSLENEVQTFDLGLYQSLIFYAPDPDASNNRQGSLEFEYQVPPWLQYDWNNDDDFSNNPTATLTFGLYRGNDRIIYQREIEK